MKKEVNILGGEGNGKIPDEYERILQYSAKYRAPFINSKEEAFELLKEKIANGTTVEIYPVHKRINIKYIMSATAAILILLLGVWQVLFRMPIEKISIPRGEHIDYKLPDGSLVFMNAESKISFNKKNFNRKRKLTLEGEAFFSIRKGSTFTINTDYADIKILGTSFNIYSRKESFKVACVTGKVQVISGEHALILAPGESAVFENTTLLKYKERNIETIANWRAGEFYYENTPLNTVFDEIERQFNVNFALPEIDGKYFTGSFTNKNLVDALDIVCIPMELTYEIGRNSQIFIHTKMQ